MRRSIVLLWCAFLLVSGAQLAHAGETASATKALRFGKIVDGKGKVWNDAIVLIRGERILDVITDPARIPAGTEVIDLRRYTAIPGLIDVHTHITFYWDQTSKIHPFEQLNSTRPAVAVFLAQENARRTLEAGVTTVRDLGSSDWDDIAMRDLINRGAMIGPRGHPGPNRAVMVVLVMVGCETVHWLGSPLIGVSAIPEAVSALGRVEQRPRPCRHRSSRVTSS